MMNETQIEAFKAIVNYLDESERRHFISENEPDDHIYRASMILKEFIDGNASHRPAPKPNDGRGVLAVPDDVLESMRQKITWSLLNFSSLPDSIKEFVDSAMKGENAALLRVAHRALLDYQTDDLPV